MNDLRSQKKKKIRYFDLFNGGIGHFSDTRAAMYEPIGSKRQSSRYNPSLNVIDLIIIIIVLTRHKQQDAQWH